MPQFVLRPLQFGMHFGPMAGTILYCTVFVTPQCTLLLPTPVKNADLVGSAMQESLGSWRFAKQVQVGDFNSAYRGGGGGEYCELVGSCVI